MLSILLELKILVARDKDFEAGGQRQCEQLAVPLARPTLLLRRPDIVPSEVRHELPRKLLIEQNAHDRSRLHPRSRGQQSPARVRRREKRRETPRCCSLLRGSRSDCGRARACRRTRARHRGFLDRCGICASVSDSTTEIGRLGRTRSTITSRRAPPAWRYPVRPEGRDERAGCADASSDREARELIWRVQNRGLIAQLTQRHGRNERDRQDDERHSFQQAALSPRRRCARDARAVRQTSGGVSPRSANHWRRNTRSPASFSRCVTAFIRHRRRGDV